VSNADDEFGSARRDTDPAGRAGRSTELLVVYRQRTVELARLRRGDRRLLQEQGLSYAAVAAGFGLGHGRIGQITQTAPPTERALFGVGPVTAALPLRSGGRSLPVVTSEGAVAYERLWG
jgi:hypothetical protein